MRRLWFLMALVLVAAFAAASLALRPAAPVVAMDVGISVDPPRPLAEFELVDHRGQGFDNARLEGRWSLLFIGFTHCPDICPSTLSLLSGLEVSLSQQAIDLQTVFVSVDPERDTPETLADYVGFFGDVLIAATGRQNQLDRLCDSLDFAYVTVPMGKGRYSVDHSGALALIDPQGRLAGYFFPPFEPAAIETDLRRLAMR
jgi:protein SCO1